MSRFLVVRDNTGKRIINESCIVSVERSTNGNATITLLHGRIESLNRFDDVVTALNPESVQ